MSRGSIRRSRFAVVAVGLAASIVLAPPAEARKIRSVVVGIDRYLLAPLKGAVKDALDIGNALKSIGAEVTLLIDGDADRKSVLAAWDKTIDESQPGDLIVLSYAGHGGQEPEAVPGSEADGMDETFLLGGFTPRAPGNAERIRDDEVYERLKRAKGRTVLFIADSCHSGTMTRAASRTGVRGSRFMDYGAIVDDPLPPPPRGEKSAETGDLDHVMFLAGVADHLEVQEIIIDGDNRGALSYAVARGLRGEADQDGDGGISRTELESFVRATILSASNGRQQVQVEGSARGGDLTAPKPFLLGLTGAGEVDVGTLGASLPRSIALATASTPASLTWDVSGGVMIGPDGAVVARLLAGDTKPKADTRSATRTAPSKEAGASGDWKSQLAAVTGVTAKYMLAERLRAAVSARPLSVTLAPAAHAYHEKEPLKLTVALGREQERFLTLFNVGPAGDVNFLYPLAAYKDAPSLPEGRSYDVSVDVHPPFGAEHFLAVVTREQALHLQTLLQRMDGKTLTPETVAELAGEIRASGGRVGLIQAVTATAD